MQNLIIFIINPVLYIIYKIINYKTFLKRKKEYLLALSLAIINTYIPYNAGDTVRYAFKYYHLMELSLNEAWNIYLPEHDYLFYRIIFIFSRLHIPFNIYVIITNFIMIYIIFSLLKEINNKKNKLTYFLLMYTPVVIGLGIRFPMACYLTIYSLLRNKFIYFIISIFIHPASSIIFIIYFINKFFYKKLKKLKQELLILFLLSIIALGNIICLNIDILNKSFPQIYYIRKMAFYIQERFNYCDILTTKIYINYSFFILSFVFSYFLLIFTKNKKNERYYFLILFGTFILAFTQITNIPFRYIHIFNIFFIIFILENDLKNSLLLYLYKVCRIIFIIIDIGIIFYYSSYFYMKNYSKIPMFIYPTIIQIVGKNNLYNEKIKNIVKIYPQKEKIGKGITVHLVKYYEIKK